MNPECDADNNDSCYMLLCPPCLAKLQHSLKFDVRERYKKLLVAFEELDFADDVCLVHSIMTKERDNDNVKK